MSISKTKKSIKKMFKMLHLSLIFNDLMMNKH